MTRKADMTPKAKANELFDQFYEYSEGYTQDGKDNNAVNCALIAVRELISETGSKFWYDVQAELKFLCIIRKK